MGYKSCNWSGSYTGPARDCRSRGCTQTVGGLGNHVFVVSDSSYDDSSKSLSGCGGLGS